ncbi:hypothetical protein [Kamptonema sp. UHCC 0994]|nr:hypothetical protein [Kamptonema sp. UHCC 0994]MDF0552914.1 hypothetical protein [Kamptonema sp. UHCC 0994]
MPAFLSTDRYLIRVTDICDRPNRLRAPKIVRSLSIVTTTGGVVPIYP